jgi:acetyl esterase/lipase
VIATPQDPLTLLDPEIAAMVSRMPRLDLDDVDAARRVAKRIYEQAAGGRPAWEDDVDITDVTITAAPDDDRNIALRIFRPRRPTAEPTAILPAMIWLHGGAFVLGDLEANALQSGRYAAPADVVVVHVDYRLAPEHPFPAGLDDGYAALAWVAGEAAALGVDPDRIAIAGSSAGGCLAAAVTLLARDRDGPKIAFQMLNYPVIDDRMATRSSREFTNTPMWDATNTSLMWSLYLQGVAPGSGDVSPYAAPGRASVLGGLPPAFILTCELDPLRDEGIAYATRLLAAGVSVELHNVPGVCHGFDVLPASVSRRALDWQIAALRRALHGSSG